VFSLRYRDFPDTLQPNWRGELRREKPARHRILFPEDIARQKAVIERDEKLDWAARDHPPRQRQESLFQKAHA
jgi:hypothetical protein